MFVTSEGHRYKQWLRSPLCSQDWADIIDFLTMHPDARRRVLRLLGEIQATST